MKKMTEQDEEESLCYCGYPVYSEKCICQDYPICVSSDCDNVVMLGSIHGWCEECHGNWSRSYSKSIVERDDDGER